ncbi:MAG: acyl-CoA desaturase [Propionibacteriaceae bacterium]
MSTSTLSATPVAGRQERVASDFGALRDEILEAGLLDRRVGYYVRKFAITFVGFAAVWVALVMLGDGWWQLGTAALLGVCLTQLAFLGHEASHRQIFSSGKANDWSGLVLANLFVGLSYGWWTSKHNRHHGNPNTLQKDPDLTDIVVSFTPDQAKVRTGLIRWINRRQGYLFFPLLTLEGINLHRDAFKTVLGSKPVKHRSLEIILLVVRVLVVTAVPFFLLPLGVAFAFLGVHLAVFGVYMGSSFAPNHKGMPILDARSRLSFLHRQVLTARNIRANRFIDWLMGGLNYQIEHHLFPSMPRPHLPAAQAIVRRFCEQHGLNYTEVGYFRSYGIVVEYLNRVGLGRRDPFDCPLMALPPRP